jgi:hypothetical protein
VLNPVPYSNKCKECGGEKTPSDFCPTDNRCKKCRALSSKRYRDKSPEKYREYIRGRASTDEGKAQKAAKRIRNKEKHVAWTQEWRKRNPEKYKAERAVTNAIKSGSLVRKPCGICGEPRSEAHHDDYTKPLEVRWLCAKHHGVTRLIDGDGDEDGR